MFLALSEVTRRLKSQRVVRTPAFRNLSQLVSTTLLRMIRWVKALSGHADYQSTLPEVCYATWQNPSDLLSNEGSQVTRKGLWAVLPQQQLRCGLNCLRLNGYGKEFTHQAGTSDECFVTPRRAVQSVATLRMMLTFLQTWINSGLHIG
jgi:hypothetical protein